MRVQARTMVRGYQHPRDYAFFRDAVQVRRVRSHGRLRNRGAESVGEPGVEWVGGRATRRCDRALRVRLRSPRRCACWTRPAWRSRWSPRSPAASVRAAGGPPGTVLFLLARPLPVENDVVLDVMYTAVFGDLDLARAAGLSRVRRRRRCGRRQGRHSPGLQRAGGGGRRRQLLSLLSGGRVLGAPAHGLRQASGVCFKRQLLCTVRPHLLCNRHCQHHMIAYCHTGTLNLHARCAWICPDLAPKRPCVFCSSSRKLIRPTCLQRIVHV